MDVETYSPEEKFAYIIRDLTKTNSVKTVESIYDFLQKMGMGLINNKVLPFKLSKELITFFNSKVLSPELTLKIYKLYLDAFLNAKNLTDEEINNFFELIKLFFKIDSKLYDLTSINDFNYFLQKYFNKYYPKDNTIKHKVGDIMDILITDQVGSKYLVGWTQMPIKQIDEFNQLYIFENPLSGNDYLRIHFDSYKVQEKNTFTKEEEVNWKKNLKIGDVVDFYNYNRDVWVPGYVKYINNLGNYVIQPLGELEIISNNINFSKHSPFIQYPLKFTYKYDFEDEACFTKIVNVEVHHPYRFFLPVTKDNYTVPFERLNNFSLEFYDLINSFIIKVITSNILADESLSIVYIYSILNLIIYCRDVFNMKYISKYIYDNCWEPLKKVYYKYSITKQKLININLGWINIVSQALRNLDSILFYNDNYFNLFNYMPEFYLTFGYNCFKFGDSLEKRLLGLSKINSIINFFNLYFSLISKKKANKMSEFICNILLNIDNKDDLITTSFSDLNVHEEILSKVNGIISYFAYIKILKDKHMEYLYNIATSTPDNSDANKYIYILLNRLLPNLTLSQKKIILNQVISCPYDKIRKCDIELAKNILKSISSEENFLLIAQTFLDYYYQYIKQNQKFNNEYINNFGKIISYAKDSNNLMILYTIYFKKVLEELIKQKNLNEYRYYFILIKSLYNSIEDLDKNSFNIYQIKEELKKIFYEKYNNSGIIVDKLLELYNLDKNEDYLMDIVDIFNGFINLIGDLKYFTTDSILKLADILIFKGNKSDKNRNNFLNVILNIKKEEAELNQLYENLFEKINNYLDTSNEYLDEELLFALLKLYERVNNKEPKIKDKTGIEKFEIEKNKYLEKRDPFKNKYFDIIWKMFYKSSNTDKISDFLQDFSLKNFNVTERYELWEKLVKKIFEDINTNIIVGLTMLQCILKISEKYGNAKVKSHICDIYSMEYKKILTLECSTNEKNFINIKTAKKKQEASFNINVSSTIWDIKYFVEEIFGYDPIIQKIIIDKNIEIKDKDESLNLYQVFPNLINTDENVIEVFIKRSNDVSNTPKYPLLTDDNNDLSDKFIEIIFNIFTIYSENEVLSPKNFAQFIKGAYEPLDKTQIEIEDIFIEKFNKFSNNKGYLTIDDFLLYFANMAQNDNNLTYSILENFGYTKSLDYYLDTLEKDNVLFYQKNNMKELMPRYFISNNLEYMKKIFNILKIEENEVIYNLTKNLINDLSTPEILKNILIEDKDKNKLDELLNDDNLEFKAYIYDIIVTIFNDELNYERNIVNNFIYNNLDKIINEFIKIYNNKGTDLKNLSNKAQYRRYYISIIRLLLFCFNYIIDQDELNNYIGKLEENKEIDFKKIKIDLAEEKKILIKKINLANLLNIILNILSLLNGSGKIKKKKK